MEPRTLRTDLEALRARLRGLWATYGVLRLLAVVAAAAALVYALDRNLSLPATVRGLLGLAVAAAAVVLLARGVLRPLSRRLDAHDIAGVVEERFPEFDGRLLSTLQLEGEALDEDRNVSVALVERLRERTLEVRRGVSLEAIFDLRRLRNLAAAAIALLALDVGFAIANPEHARIFVDRLLLGDSRWPRRTTLSVLFPEAADYFKVEYDGSRPTRVLIARGASLPVTVRADGDRPEFVELDAEAREGRAPSAGLLPTGPSEWVGRFRGVRDDFTFRPRGGDDDGAGREVAVEVFLPPEIARVQTEITFPVYTGLEPRVQDRGDVEAPVGSRVEVRVDVQAEVTEGVLLFDGGAETIALRPADGAANRLVGEFVVDASRTWSVNLVGTNGFRNLEPSSYAVVAVPDRPPTLRVLEPPRADADVTPNAVIGLRVAADDDFGVATMELAMQPLGREEDRRFDLLAGTEDQDRRRKMVYAVIDLAQTTFPHAEEERSPQPGDSYAYAIGVTDNHHDLDGASAPNATVVSQRRFDVVSVNEKLRLLTERQIRMKDEVRGIREFQDEKLQRLRQILADFEQTEGDAAPARDDLMSLEIAQGQMTTRSTRLARSFAALFEEYLLNRLDASAAADRLIPMLVERKRASVVIDDFDFGVYRPIVGAYQEGVFGDLDVVGRLLVMLAHSLDVAEDLSPAAASAISEARLIRDPADRPDAARVAVARQEEILARLDELLVKMDEWEDFQEILTLFRDLLEDQRNLHERTRSKMGGN